MYTQATWCIVLSHILGIEGGLVFSDDVLSRVTLSNELEGHSVHLVQTRLVCSQLLCRNSQTSVNLYTACAQYVRMSPTYMYIHALYIYTGHVCLCKYIYTYICI